MGAIHVHEFMSLDGVIDAPSARDFRVAVAHRFGVSWQLSLAEAGSVAAEA